MSKSDKIMIGLTVIVILLMLPNTIESAKNLMESASFMEGITYYAANHWQYAWTIYLMGLISSVYASTNIIIRYRKEKVGIKSSIKKHTRVIISGVKSFDADIQIDYIAENYNSLPLLLTKFIETRVEFSSGDKSISLPPSTNIENKEILQNDISTLSTTRILNIDVIRKLAALITNSGINFIPLILTVSGKGYFGKKDIEVPFSTVFRIPHYDLIGLIRKMKDEEDNQAKTI